jgi:2-dehydro-3-deoxygluconokinase
MKRFVTFGETMMQYNAEYQGEYDPDGSHIADVAGAESNVAVNIHKLLPDEVDTLWISRLGDDDAGRRVQRQLKGRTTTQAERYTDEFTGVSYLNHFGDEHVKNYQRQGSAASKLRFSDIEPHLENRDLLHVTGITPVLSETCKDTIYSALEWSSNHNLPICFDVNYREPLWPPEEARLVFDRMVDDATVVKVGHDEAEKVWSLGLKAEEYARRFFRGNVRLSVVTRASQGALVFDGSYILDHPGYAVDIVDPVGAGDAFVAGFLSGILQSHTILEYLDLPTSTRLKVLSHALDIANVCGALTCTQHGDTAAMPTMERVDEFLDQHGSRTITL